MITICCVDLNNALRLAFHNKFYLFTIIVRYEKGNAITLLATYTKITAPPLLQVHRKLIPKLRRIYRFVAVCWRTCCTASPVHNISK